MGARAWRGPRSRPHDRASLSAVKLYLAVRDDLDSDPAVLAVGINCLNESDFSDTTPCLAWNILFRSVG